MTDETEAPVAPVAPAVQDDGASEAVSAAVGPAESPPDVATTEQVPPVETPAEPTSPAVPVLTDFVAVQRTDDELTGRVIWRNAGGDVLDVKTAIFPR